LIEPLFEIQKENPMLTQVSINKGIECDDQYTFQAPTKPKNKFKVQIIKEESKELEYKVGLIFSGLMKKAPIWTIKINGFLICDEDEPLFCIRSKKFVFKPAGQAAIEIQETDDTATQSVWVDLSEVPYKISKESPVVSPKPSEELAFS